MKHPPQQSLLWLIVMLPLCGVGLAAEPLPAFPGAEGFGAHARGGRGGKVLFVTNLKDYDPAKDEPIPGSLRAACLTEGPRTVVFRVSGAIPLKTALVVHHPYLTLAGQTAPGVGVCLTRYATVISGTHDVVVRYLRFRPGDAVGRERAKLQDDASWVTDSLSVTGSRNVIIDHCSASWSTDEVLSVSQTPLDNVTVQWCFITESLHASFHYKGPHGYGGIDSRAANAHISRHHNLYAHNTTRSPKVGSVHDENLSRVEAEFQITDHGMVYDFRNNVIYNWYKTAGYTSPSHDRIRINYVGNYLKQGPDTREPTAFGGSKRAKIHLAANMMDGNRAGWEIVRGEYQKLVAPLETPAVTTEPSEIAYQRVLAEGGASKPRRDAIDARVAAEVASGAGRIIDSQNDVGGYGQYVEETRPAGYDVDADGMPNAWESAHQLDPTRPDNNQDPDGDGYTNLEEFLNDTDPRASNG